MDIRVKQILGLAYMPFALAIQPRWKGDEFSFLVLTYYKRFDNFKNLIKQLDFWYPKAQKLIYINGRNDNPQQQREYLEQVKFFLSGFGSTSAHYYENFVPPSKLWNWGFMESRTEKIVVLNDSVTVTGPFIAKKMLKTPICKINNSFANYIISKRLIGKIGWFDENFIAGASQTDGDMDFRMLKAGIPLYKSKSLYITWKKFENPVVWDKKLGGVVEGKTSNYNTEYWQKKWRSSAEFFEGALWVREFNTYIGGPNPGFETPDPYPEIRKQWQKEYPL